MTTEPKEVKVDAKKALKLTWGGPILLTIVCVLAITADRLTKLWITSNYEVGELAFNFLFVNIRLLHNFGSAFSLIETGGNWLPVISIIVTVLALLIYAIRWITGKAGVLMSIGFGLIIGGAIGNLIDRFALGYVPDFIEVGFWPVFNIADSAVTVGAIILIIGLLLGGLRRKKPTKTTPEATAEAAPKTGDEN